MPDSAPASSVSARPALLRLLYAEIVQGAVLLRAPGLAYSTLASMVPILAIVFAVLSTPAFRDSQEKVFDALASKLVINDTGDGNSTTAAYKTLFRDAIRPIAEKLGAVGGIGGAALMLTAYLLFCTIEQAFNSIWRVSGSRPFFTRVAITTSLVFWTPVLLVVSVSAARYLDSWPLLGAYLTPAVFSTLLFTGLFMVMPYARVQWQYALAGGALTALFWELTKILFLFYISTCVSYDQIYGALGLIPMLLLWLYLNWVVILAGAAFTCCLQQREKLEQEWLQRAGVKPAAVPTPAPAPAAATPEPMDASPS